jgi:hypothetical protein
VFFSLPCTQAPFHDGDDVDDDTDADSDNGDDDDAVDDVHAYT